MAATTSTRAPDTKHYQIITDVIRVLQLHGPLGARSIFLFMSNQGGSTGFTSNELGEQRDHLDKVLSAEINSRASRLLRIGTVKPYRYAVAGFDPLAPPPPTELTDTQLLSPDAAMSPRDQWWFTILDRAKLPSDREGFALLIALATHYAKVTGDTAANPSTIVSQYLKWLYPELKSLKTKHGRVYRFPPLDECRAVFEQRVLGRPHWPQEEEEWMAMSDHNTALSRRGEPSYDLIKRKDGRTTVTTVTVSCAKCAEQHIQPWNAGHHPTLIKKRMLTLGWEFDPFSKKGCICPNCNKRGHPKQPKPIQPSQEEAVEVSSPEPFIQEDVDDMQTTLRDLTPDERARVRHLLDHHFDDTRGRYLEGYTDKRVGEEANVPWAAVKKLRDAAYATLREDERMTELRDEMDKLRAKNATAVEEVSNKLGSMAKQITELAAKAQADRVKFNNDWAVLEAKLNTLRSGG